MISNGDGYVNGVKRRRYRELGSSKSKCTKRRLVMFVGRPTDDPVELGNLGGGLRIQARAECQWEVMLLTRLRVNGGKGLIDRMDMSPEDGRPQGQYETANNGRDR